MGSDQHYRQRAAIGNVDLTPCALAALAMVTYVPQRIVVICMSKTRMRATFSLKDQNQTVKRTKQDGLIRPRESPH